MKRWMTGYSAICLVLAIGTSSPSAAAKRNESLNDQLQAVAVAAQKNDCATALGIVAVETAKSGFQEQSDQIRIYVYQIGVACAVTQGDLAVAARYAEAATRISGAPAHLWRARFVLMWQMGRIADAVTAIEEMALGNPGALNEMPSDDVASFSSVVERGKDDGLRRRLLAVLASPGYVPPEPGMSTDRYRRAYAVILAESGDKLAASALLRQIELPTVLMSISLDPRLREIKPGEVDVRAAAEQHMSKLREISAAHAGVIAPQLDVAEYLLLLGKPEDALAALDVIQPGKPGGPTYADQGDRLNWWWDTRARAYSMLGRYDDAVAALMQGKSISERGEPNISQTINLAAAQLRFRRFKDALETLAPIVAGTIKGSPFGMMQFRSVHGCASLLAGNAEDAKADLAYLRDHVDDAPAALLEMQLCAGDMDGAAASMIKRLDTPDQRVGALLELSDYVAPPSTYPQYPTDAALDMLKQREDVKAAITRAGGVRTFNVLQPSS